MHARTHAGLLGALAAVAIALPATAQAPTWKTYPYPDLGFAADFPAEPVRQDDQAQTARGAVPTAFVGAEFGTRAFGVTSGNYANVSGGPVTDAGAVVEGAMGGVVRGRTVTAQSTFDVPGGAGKETLSRDGSSLMRVRVYYRAPRVYIVMAVTTDTMHPDLLQDATASRFFSAFTPLSQ